MIVPGSGPDVTVVVGGVEFHEHRRHLIGWSDFFDAAFRRDEMKQTDRFELRNRDPGEWRIIKELVAPLSTREISKDNVYIAMSWFDELGCCAGLKRCDDFLSTEIIPNLIPEDELKMEVIDVVVSDDVVRLKASNQAFIAELLKISSYAIQYNLRKCIECSIEYLQRIVEGCPFRLLAAEDWPELQPIPALVNMINESREHRDHLWPTLKKYIDNPQLKSIADDELLANDLLPQLISAAFDHSETMSCFHATLKGVSDAFKDCNRTSIPTNEALSKDKKWTRAMLRLM